MCKKFDCDLARPGVYLYVMAGDKGVSTTQFGWPDRGGSYFDGDGPYEDEWMSAGPEWSGAAMVPPSHSERTAWAMAQIATDPRFGITLDRPVRTDGLDG